MYYPIEQSVACSIGGKKRYRNFSNQTLTTQLKDYFYNFEMKHSYANLKLKTETEFNDELYYLLDPFHAVTERCN